MPEYEYQVVPFSDLVTSPKWYSLAKTKLRHIALSMEDGINAKAVDGWELVSTHATFGNGFAVFRRKIDSPPKMGS